MNTLQNNPVSSFFSNIDDARAIEDAVRAAIKVVLKVFCTINNSKMQEYEKKVAERDKENEMMRIRMESAERELITLRRFKHSVEQSGGTLNPDTDCIQGRDSYLSSEDNRKQRVCVMPLLQGGEKEMLSECAWKMELMSPYEGTYSDTHSQERDTTVCSWGSTAGADLNHQVPSERATGPGASEDQTGGQRERGRTLSASPVITAKVKEEPPDFQSICIKWEMSEESDRREECEAYPRPPLYGPLSQCRGGEYLDLGTQNMSFGFSEQPGERMSTSESCLRKRLSNRERQQKYREKIRADPERQRVYREKDRSRYRKRRKLICDLPEHSQKLRREAWREAARRHRARKKTTVPR
ncbi:hypothetical protein AAFF_G00426490 [Aldrovandia affinis]|uniref:Uncharacterized protein n=1 Tax=Aldrovandia affinis TaxID=143900 RepID=A0AAD7S9E5_9TELE|nr:hypothetical protein AAFF_G00426490 [Aldrovandia affinis]